MRTRDRTAGATATPPVASPTPRAWVREHLPGLLVVCLAGGLVALFFLGLYLVKHYPMPIGWDTPRYLSQANFVAERGLSGVPHSLPPPSKTLASRAGFPVVVLPLSSLFTVSAFKLAATVPVTAAVAVALAAGAFVSFALRRGVWEMAAAAAVVGTSAVLVRLMAPETYTDNLLAAAVLVAALLPILTTAREGRGFLAAILLLAAGGLAHGPSLGIVLVALGLVALLYAPGSWRAWRRGGAGLLETPAVRLGVVAGGAAALTAAGIYGLLRTPPDTPKLTRGELRKKLREDLPLYRFPVVVPLAGVGVATLAALRFGDRTASESDDEGQRRFTAGFVLAILAAWAAVLVVGIVLYYSGRNSPAHRSLSFLLPLPILIAVGLLAMGRLVASRGARVAGVAVVLIGLAGLAFLGYRDLYSNLADPAQRGVEWIDKGKVQDAETAEAYLEAVHIPQTQPVVVVIDDRGPNPLSYVPEMMYIMRSVLPPERIEHVYAYVGDPNRYVAGERTFRKEPRTYNANVERFWPKIQQLLPQRPVALLLSSYNPAYGAYAEGHPDQVVAPGVVALTGPPAAEAVGAPPIPSGPQNALQGGVFGVGTLVVLTLIGLGWAVAFLPRGVRSFEALALSPAFGIGFLILGGVLVDAVGIRLKGIGGVLTVVVVMSAGFALAVRRLRPAGLDLFAAR